MKNLKLLLLTLFVITSGFKCVKEDDGIGGKGGSVYITLMPKLNGTSVNLINCKMYIKYNAITAPAGNIYDDSVLCTKGDTAVVAQFLNLKRGDYFFHCTGLDNANAKPVTGDLQFKIIDYYNNLYNMAVIE